MAYSPFIRAGCCASAGWSEFAQQHAMTPAQVALAWLLGQDGVIAIPKAGSRERVRENAGALAHPLSPAQPAELDRLFAPPKGPSRLAML